MRYLIIGDLHGRIEGLGFIVSMLKERNVVFDEIIQVGDFGIYPGVMKRLTQFMQKLKLKIHFIDGNHEDHTYIRECRSKLEKIGIVYHPRGDVTVLPDGTKIGWCGGAYNVDRPQEMIGPYWNFPSPSEINVAAANFNAVGGVDLLVTHSCPTGLGIGIKGSEFFTESIQKYIVDALFVRAPPINDCGDKPLTDLWNKLIVKPKDVTFGHFHSYHRAKVGETNFYCVGAGDPYYLNKSQMQIFIYDSELKQVLS